MSDKLTLLVVIASTRPGRVGKPVGDWFVEQARQDGTFTVQVADLKEIGLPFLDEPNHPAQQKYQHEHTKAWSRLVAGADAFVFVQPEYNYSICAPLKNALDFLFNEWAHKPAGIVNYGGISAGLRAAEHSKQVMTALQMMVVKPAVSIPNVGPLVKEGTFDAPEPVVKSVAPMLKELDVWARSLKELRGKK